MPSPRLRRRLLQAQARRKKKRAARAGVPPVLGGGVAAGSAAPTPAAPSGGLAWRLVPLRGRFLAPFTKLVLAALPEHPATFSAVDVAKACEEAETVIGGDPPCNPAEIMDLLVSRGIVEWSADGFRKKQRRMRPRA